MFSISDERIRAMIETFEVLLFFFCRYRWIHSAKQAKECVDDYRYNQLKKRVVILIGWRKVWHSPKKIAAFAVCVLV